MRYAVKPTYTTAPASTDLTRVYAITRDGCDYGIRCESEVRAERIAHLLDLDDAAKREAEERLLVHTRPPRALGLRGWV